MTSWYKKFASQPHQPFFTNGVIFFILFITLFAFSYSNSLNLDTSILTYHAYALIFVVFIQFFLGFLFVVFPYNLLKLFHFASKILGKQQTKTLKKTE